MTFHHKPAEDASVFQDPETPACRCSVPGWTDDSTHQPDIGLPYRTTPASTLHRVSAC